MNSDTIAIQPPPSNDDAILKDRINRAKEGDNQTWAEFADAAGVKPGTLTSWASGNYNNGKPPAAMIAKLTLYLDTRAERLASKKDEPGFVMTPTAERIDAILTDAQFGPEIVCIAGNAGIGKTITLNQYRQKRSNVWMMTMRPSIRSPNNLVSRLAQIMDVERKIAPEITDTIGARVVDTGGLIVIDEAQNLTSTMLDELRYIYDIYGVGLALVGNLTLHGHVAGGKAGSARKPAFAQINSRIGFREIFKKPMPGDIEAILDSWDVVDAESRKILRNIAAKAGGLREMVKTLSSAQKAARGLECPMDAKILKAAWNQRDNQET